MSQGASNTEIQFALTVNTNQLSSDLSKVETSLMRILNVVKQLTGGNPDVQKAIQYIQSLITIAQAAQAAIRAVQIASGPVGWLYAGTSILAAGMTSYGAIQSTMGA